MMKLLNCFLICVLTITVSISAVNAVKGIDIAYEGYSAKLLSCYNQQGYTFGIVRCYLDQGKPDTNCATSVAKLWAANFTHVDVYMFPAFFHRDTKSPQEQVKEAVTYLKDNNVKYGMFWLDVEGNWGRPDFEENQKFFEGLVEGALSMELDFGVYTNQNGWTTIMGMSGYDKGSKYPLWYAHYDHNPSFDDWVPFNGWSEPHMKQYAASICVVNAVKGFDISDEGYTVELLSCYNKLGYTFATVRCYQDKGIPDPNCPTTVANLWAANFTHVDVYMFPAFHHRDEKSPQEQVKEAVTYLKDNNVKYGMFWLDVEGNWARPDWEENQKFFEGLVEGAINMGVNMGIYSSLYEWTNIMGESGYDKGSKYPLWYAHYDHTPSFDDFVPFNGWSQPHIKQYAGDQYIKECSTALNIDQDYYP